MSGVGDRRQRAAVAVGRPAGGSGRIQGVDAARGLAILGMAAVHFTLRGAAAAGGGAALTAGPRGRAAILFVLVAGVGVTLLDRSRSASRARTRQKLLWRAAVLLPLGLALQELPHSIAVILQNYALLFLVALAALALSDRMLIAAAAVLLVAGPLVHVAAEAAWPSLIDGAPTALSDPVVQIAGGLVLTGTYPLVTWSAPLLLGMWLGRLALTDPRVQARMLAVGSAIAVAMLWGGVVLDGATPARAPQWWRLAIDAEPHSQSLVWLWQASAAAVAALAVCLVLTDALPRLVRPLVALGQLAFTVYVGHILVIAAAPDLLQSDQLAGVGLRVIAFAAVSSGLAMAWRSQFRRGPLEAAIDAPLTLVARRRDRARAPRPPAAEADRLR